MYEEPTMTKNAKQPDSVSSVLKVFGILQALGETRGIGVTELSQKVMTSKSTVYRFLQTMKSLGYVHQDGDSDKYSLTLKLFELGSMALQNVDLIRIADVYMRKLSEQTLETIHLGAHEDDSVVYIHKIDSRYSLGMQSRIGFRNPLASTALGKVMLAWLPEDDAETILRRATYKAYTKNSPRSADDVMPLLSQARENGYAEDFEEMEDGLCCIAVPLFDRFGKVVAGMSISLPVIRYDPARKQDIIQLLHDAARQISSELGCRDYPF